MFHLTGKQQDKTRQIECRPSGRPEEAKEVMPLFEAPGRAPLAYADEGPRSGPSAPLLLIHGWAASGAFFQPQIDHFARTRRVIAPDLRGHGGSRSGPTPTIVGMADDVEALLDHLGVDDAIAVGWSMGATVLWKLLGEGRGQRIAGLVTIDMTPCILNDVAWRLGLADGFDALDCARAVVRMKEDWKQFSTRVAANALAGEKPAPALLRVFEKSFADNDAELMAAAWDSLCNSDLRAVLADIDTPMLVTHGMRSKLYTPAVSTFVAEAAPNAARAPFHASGHAPHLEEPERFNRLLNEFAAILSGQDVRRDIRRLGEHAAAHQA